MSIKQQVSKKKLSITCLQTNELKRVHGGVGRKEKTVIVAASTLAGAAICGPKCATIGHAVGSTALKALAKKKKKQ